MADVSTQIEQFRKMAEADPDNELGHFSYGRALLDGGRAEEAIVSFDKALAINPKLSKVYQLKATAQLQLKDDANAIITLTTGVKIADERGDLMVRNTLLDQLKTLGAAVPELASAKNTQALGEGQVKCSRCGRVSPKMANPPFSNAQGKLIQENVCPPCWTEWIGMGTKVINELRLPLHDPHAQRIFDQHMMEFLNLKSAD